MKKFNTDILIINHIKLENAKNSSKGIALFKN